jgi:ornithine cyclodeaminase
MKLSVVTESDARRLVGIADAIVLVEAAFADLYAGTSILFPATRGHGSDPATRFGVKAGYDATRRLPGLKVGSYWPQNIAAGLEAHGSTTLLLDDETGFPKALVAATHLNALRTAASDAVAVRHLARADADVLTLVGTGHQAYWEALAIAEVRKLRRIHVCGRNAGGVERLVQRLHEAGLPAVAAAAEDAVPLADIVCTVTAARQPLFAASLVRAGTHVSAMGADGPGKQELDPALFARASLWADAPEQSVRIGEFQHAGETEAARVAAIGGLIAGKLAGRSGSDEITVYDSSGIALQDLAIAAFALERAVASAEGCLSIDLA